MENIRIEKFYLDINGNKTDEAHAVDVVIRQYSQQGELLQTSVERVVQKKPEADAGSDQCSYTGMLLVDQGSYVASDAPETWICPNDETENTGDICIICGLPRPMSKEGKPKTFGDSEEKRIKEDEFDTGRKKLWIGIALAAVLVIVFITVIDRPHAHDWKSATCITPKTCTICGETSGETLAHSWAAATYYAPKTCSVCGKTTGDRLQKPAETEPEKYIRQVLGRWEKINLKDGSFNLNVHAFSFSQELEQCESMTINMDVAMNAGTSCKDWQFWGRVDGVFKKLGRIELPEGTGSTSKTFTFDEPITLDAVVVTPTIVGGYSWSLNLVVSDVYLAD